MTTLLEVARTGVTLGLPSVATRGLALMGDPLAQLDRHRPGIEDPFAIMAKIRQRGPFSRSRTGLWVTASHDVCREVLRSKDASSRNVDERDQHRSTIPLSAWTRRTTPG